MHKTDARVKAVLVTPSPPHGCRAQAHGGAVLAADKARARVAGLLEHNTAEVRELAGS
jgi:hypothetical protein